MLQKISLPASDLFFMVDNTKYWNALEHSKEDALEKLTKSATDFCELMTHWNVELEPQDVVDDYLSRVGMS